MKLVSYYSKLSVKHENSTCLDFVPVQVKHIVQNSHFENKNESYQQNDIPMAFKILNNFLVIQNQQALKIPNVLILHQYKFHP